jgi:hypothetical protein
MSYEVAIKRPTGRPSLTSEDFTRIVREDASLSGGQREPIVWTDPQDGRKRYINVVPESGELSTADMQGDEDSICRFLDKLRSIARVLDARVIGEGEDITDPTPASPRRGGCASVIACAASFIVIVVCVFLSLR